MAGQARASGPEEVYCFRVEAAAEANVKADACPALDGTTEPSTTGPETMGSITTGYEASTSPLSTKPTIAAIATTLKKQTQAQIDYLQTIMNSKDSSESLKAKLRTLIDLLNGLSSSLNSIVTDSYLQNLSTDLNDLVTNNRAKRKTGEVELFSF